MKSWIMISERHGFKFKLCDFKSHLTFLSLFSDLWNKHNVNSIYFATQRNNPDNVWETIFKL